MKNRVSAFLLSVLSLIGLTSCDEEVIYTVEKRDFYYSVDNGATYGNERVELEVGKTVLMKVLITITTNVEDKENITGSITIPNIKAIDAYYLRGQTITPIIDSINSLTTYPFTISTNEDWTFIFEFAPAAEARVQMTLDFDDPVPSIYDGIYTIKFVKPSEEEPDNGTGEDTGEQDGGDGAETEDGTEESEE